MDLPPALAPWRACLEDLPAEVALALGPLVQRLHAAVGPFSSSDRSGDGEPDGFSGLARRGSYERLLLSEWLLAEELPDEFNRRAATSEHAFLALARREPAAARWSVALFDSGPDQWGTPRLAHLAAVVVLSARAARAGAGFQWGMVQYPTSTPMESVTPHSLDLLRRARQAGPASEADLLQWHAFLTARAGDGDLWLVGGARLARLARAAIPSRISCITVADPLEPDGRDLAVTVHSRRGEQALRLPLPEPQTCVRLLRDPFSAGDPLRVAARATSLRPTSNLQFLPTGQKLAARLGAGHVVLFPIPTSTRDGVGAPREYRSPSGNPILGVGRIGKCLVAITAPAAGGALTVESLDAQMGNIHVWLGDLPDTVGPLPCDPDEMPLESVLWIGDDPRAGDQTLVWRWDARAHVIHLRRITGKWNQSRGDWPGTTAALARVGDHCVIAREHRGWRLSRMGPDGSGPTQPFGPAENLGKVFFGCGRGWEDNQFGLVAAEHPQGVWRVWARGGEQLFQCPEGSRVCGVTAFGASGGEPALLLLRDDRRTLELVGRSHAHVVCTSAQAITEVAVSATAPWLAYLTAGGDLSVYSVRHCALLGCFRLQEEQ